MTDSIIIAAFLFFVVFLIVLDIAMIVSLVVPGDERKQMVVWKASTYTLIALSAPGSQHCRKNDFAAGTADQSIYPVGGHCPHLLCISVIL